MMPVCKQMRIQPAVPSGIKLDPYGNNVNNINNNPWRQRDKVVIVMGATGTGKSRLSIDLATTAALGPAEIINSDKMQVYEGLDIVTNKITEEERCGVPHHLLGTFRSLEEDFTAVDFREGAVRSVESVLGRDKLPIVVGGSNSFVEGLVEEFGSKYEWCLLWVDVAMPVLRSRVEGRVEEMVRRGMVEEAREVFEPRGGYGRGVRRAIGLPELDGYFREGGSAGTAALLREAVREVKENTCKLAGRQLGKIHRLRDGKGWRLHRLDATEACRRRPGEDEAELAWQRHVAGPAAEVVRSFLYNYYVTDFTGLPATALALAGMRPALAAYR